MSDNKFTLEQSLEWAKKAEPKKPDNTVTQLTCLYTLLAGAGVTLYYLKGKQKTVDVSILGSWMDPRNRI